jgi:hypothetical protein
MATTTNYSWTTPDDTDLVKDGAAAIRTLGSSVDTTTKALNPSTTLGDIEYRSSTTDTNTRLAIGTTGQVLTVSGGVPAWATASAGGLTLIQETVANADSSISFTSISGTYKQLLLMWSGIHHSTTGSTFAIRFNNDSTTQYRGNGFSGLGTTVIARSMNEVSVILSGSPNLAPFGKDANLGTDFNLAAVGTLLVDNYASTTKVKTFFSQFGYYDNGASHYSSGQINGTFNTTTAITSIDIVRLTGSATFTNTADSSIRLYGVS